MPLQSHPSQHDILFPRPKTSLRFLPTQAYPCSPCSGQRLPKTARVQSSRAGHIIPRLYPSLLSWTPSGTRLTRCISPVGILCFVCLSLLCLSIGFSKAITTHMASYLTLLPHRGREYDFPLLAPNSYCYSLSLPTVSSYCPPPGFQSYSFAVRDGEK